MESACFYCGLRVADISDERANKKTRVNWRGKMFCTRCYSFELAVVDQYTPLPAPLSASASLSASSFAPLSRTVSGTVPRARKHSMSLL